jgi:hypothetical protein
MEIYGNLLRGESLFDRKYIAIYEILLRVKSLFDRKYITISGNLLRVKSLLEWKYIIDFSTFLYMDKSGISRTILG